MSMTELGLRERKKLRTRATIIEVAFELFAAQGYHETTFVQIAETAEISPSTFFNYFPGKVDVVFGVIDAITESARPAHRGTGPCRADCEDDRVLGQGRTSSRSNVRTSRFCACSR